MSKYTITPWRTQADLLHVRAQLYNLDANSSSTTHEDERQTAVSRILTSWKPRGNLPHAVESTALLVDAILHHAASTSANSPFATRAVYTAALTRFVTGFCDIGRSRERALEPSSMLAIAAQIGLPAHFVALRHEATHEEMPGLKRLVGATEEALGWLWGVYWSRLEEVEVAAGQGVRDVEEFRREVGGLLRGFRKGRRDGLRSGVHAARLEDDLRETTDACVELCGRSQGRVEVMAEVLVEERLILPATRELGTSLEGAFLIWDDLLHGFFDCLSGLREALLASLLAALSGPVTSDSSRDADREALAMWVLHLTGVQAHAKVMRWCCLHPGYWSEYIGRQILQSDSSLSDDWQDLFEASVLESGDSAVEQGVGVVKDANHGNTTGVLALVEDNVHNGSQGTGWSRAIQPVAVPIGVVR